MLDVDACALPSAWTYGGSAGRPLEGVEVAEVQGRRVLRNGANRQHCVLTQEQLTVGKQARWLELEVHGDVRHLSRALFDMRHLTALFASHNRLTKIPPQIRQLTSLTALDLSHNRLTSLPAEIGELSALMHLNISHNALPSLPAEMGKLFRLKGLNVAGNPLPAELTELASDKFGGTRKVLQHLLDNFATNTCPPPSRPWNVVKRLSSDEAVAQIDVLCYNVLMHRYATTSMYSYCPTWALNWEYRKNAVLREILLYDGDVIALQEVESEQFRVLYEPELRNHGFEGIFAPKSRAKTMTIEGRNAVDGCSIFWRKNKLKLRRQHLAEFAQIAIHIAHHQDTMINRVMPKDNIALIAIFEALPGIYKRVAEPPSYTGGRTNEGDETAALSVAPERSVVGTPLVVCAAHFLWDPEFCDVKLIQTMMMIHEVARQVEEVAREYSIAFEDVPVLFCVDTNSLPASGVVEYALNGEVSKEHPDLKSFRGNEVLNGVCTNEYNDHRYTHAFKLESGIDTTAPVLTNMTMDFKGMIDYIFTTPRSLERIGYMGGLDQNWITEQKVLGFPHPHVPSDHVPIMAHYVLRPLDCRSPTTRAARYRRRSGSFSKHMKQLQGSPD